MSDSDTYLLSICPIKKKPTYLDTSGVCSNQVLAKEDGSDGASEGDVEGASYAARHVQQSRALCRRLPHGRTLLH